MTSRPKYRRASGVLVQVISVAALLAACGSGSESKSTEAWAGEVCSALSTWYTDLRDQATNASSTLQGESADLAARKADLVGFVGELGETTQAMVEQVEAAGAPDIERGEEMATGLQDGVGSIREAFADAEEQAEALPVGDPIAFAQGATTLSTAMQGALEQASTTLTGVQEKYPEAAQALDRQPDCQKLEPAE